MKEKVEKRGFIFACTEKSEAEFLEKLIFATNKVYAHKVFAIRKGDFVFLYNLDTDIIYGTFRAKTDGLYDRNLSIFNGRYPYYVEVEPEDKIQKIKNASKIFKKLNISWRSILNDKGIETLKMLISNTTAKEIKLNGIYNLEDNLFRPPIFSTTLWDYPKQSYGDTPKGNNKYPGVTPAFIIYNLLYRYTEPGDLVCDPMAGSGTTIDVCKEEKRKVIAFDIVPTRKDIIQADARNLPLKDESVDMIFIDSPYGDNIRYNEHPLNIGHIPATDERFFDELEKVMKEAYRVLKDGKVLAWLIGDQWAKGVFIPVGFKVYERLTKYFEPVDIICVVRRNQSSNTPFWHSKAIQHNFYLRGFKYLIIVRKMTKRKRKENLKIKWSYYER
ncbi:DNA methyltransferase [Candidatus Chrysopegis kryptomonas]|uniref:DNA methylase n=1 Tax=Candidatus Chryseopegocella kryptomonas TaxID=1633643 RepID=A0A0P1NUA9_9BACT|nr:DNA methyltransferase [Candidatus Chrysopegis kryptomonas]CUT02654.1 DNA methylase [Candidatus Chrysopegis kryptomonas]